jgi:hypothetical protein
MQLSTARLRGIPKNFVEQTQFTENGEQGNAFGVEPVL